MAPHPEEDFHRQPHRHPGLGLDPGLPGDVPGTALVAVEEALQTPSWDRVLLRVRDRRGVVVACPDLPAAFDLP